MISSIFKMPFHFLCFLFISSMRFIHRTPHINKNLTRAHMEGTSSACRPSEHDQDHLLVDDFYFSALYDAEEIFPIPDEKYALDIQLQETLFSSAAMYTAKVETELVKTEEIDTLLLSTLKGKQKETGESSGSAGQSSHISQVFCAICIEAKPIEEMFWKQNCSHSFCDDCIGRYVGAKIQENVSVIKCPDPKCRGVLEPHLCRSIIPQEVFDRWENALCENLILGSQKFYCPFKDCSAMLVDDGDEVVTSSECPHCRRLFCAQCKVSWHAGLDCKEFQSLKEKEREREDQLVMELAKNRRWRRCSKCKFYVEMVEGCIHITCRCGNEFCYRCGSSWPCIRCM